MAGKLVPVKGANASRDLRSGAIVFHGGRQYQVALKRRAIARTAAIRAAEHAKVRAKVHTLHDQLADHARTVKELSEQVQALHQMMKEKK